MGAIPVSDTENTSASLGGARTTPTICRVCPAHCGVLATVTDGSSPR